MQSSLSRPTRWSLPLAILSIVLVFFSLCISCVALSIAFDSTPPSDPESLGRESWLLCFVCFGVPLMLGGIASFGVAWRRRGQEREQDLKNSVLEIAAQGGGSVTAQELALRTSLSLEGAQSLLEEWAARGICRMEVESGGFTRFWFDSQRSSAGAGE